MAEIIDDKSPKVIAFYLPQYHTIPENDKWWGEGFTEWTNVRKARPLFEGHDQPKVPLNNNYYVLTEDQTKIWQADLAKKYGVFGFCYYHYWFKDGKKLLEKPAEQMLANPDIDIPFCFSWANENWSRNWDGGNREIIMKQDYGNKKDWEKHFQYLLPFFHDKRYITVNGNPLFIIYKPEQIIDIYQMTKYFRKRAKQEGFRDLCLAFQFPSYYYDMYYRDDIFDFRIAFEPVFARDEKAKGKPGTADKVKLVRSVSGESLLSVYRKCRQEKINVKPVQSTHLSHKSYDEAWNTILTQPWTDELLPGAFVDWDNTSRNVNGVVYEGYTPDKFREYFSALMRRAKNENRPMVFVNAWNEWAEGAFLEPDEKDKYGKLEAVCQAVKENE